MPKYRSWAMVVLTLWVITSHGQSDNQAPRVLETLPANGSVTVNPDITELSVTFSETMRDRSWSWAYENRDTFPRITADPSYDRNRSTNTLPVKLEPNRYYEIWLNSSQYQGFVDEAGNPLAPYKWTFTTSNRRQ